MEVLSYPASLQDSSIFSTTEPTVSLGHACCRAATSNGGAGGEEGSWIGSVALPLQDAIAPTVDRGQRLGASCLLLLLAVAVFVFAFLRANDPDQGRLQILSKESWSHDPPSRSTFHSMSLPIFHILQPNRGGVRCAQPPPTPPPPPLPPPRQQHSPTFVRAIELAGDLIVMRLAEDHVLLVGGRTVQYVASPA